MNWRRRVCKEIGRRNSDYNVISVGDIDIVVQDNNCIPHAAGVFFPRITVGNGWLKENLTKPEMQSYITERLLEG